MNDLISRQAAYDTLTEYYHHKTETQHKSLKEALNRVPTITPEQAADLSGYSDRLWKIAYERGKREAVLSAQPEDWMEKNKERILQAGIEFRIGGRLFAIREKAQ